MGKRILVVDDDNLLRRSLALSLEEAGYEVQTAATAEEGLALARSQAPDLVLHDISLPAMDGIAALRHYQNEFDLPIIFVTARRRQLDEVLGFELGAEDYITKPFDPDILLARVRAALRRAERAKSTRGMPEHDPITLAVGNLAINRLNQQVTLNGRAVDVPPRAFALLSVLASQPGKPFSVEELLERVWGAGYAGESQVVYVQIRTLRELLEEKPNLPQRIETVRGAGYRLVAPKEE